MAKLSALALAAAFYPTLLAVVLFALTRPNPVRLLGAFYVGGLLTSVTIGLLVLFVAEGTGAVTQDSHSVSPWVDLVAGLFSLGLAFAIAQGRDESLRERRRRRKEAKAEGRVDEEPRDPWTSRLLARDSMGIALGLGIILDLPSVWYLAALNQIAKSGYATTVEILLVLAFNVVMFALVEIPLLMFLFSPERARARVERLNAALRDHARQLAVTVAGLIGAYLTLSGLLSIL
jgi:hypothetical protein